MKKITFIGGGSAKFIREVTVDLFSYEESRDCHISLMDIDAERVELSRKLVEKMIKDNGYAAKVEATTDQRKALAGADFVIVTIMVGGYDCYKKDVKIPGKYGVFQTVSDTTGPGAVMRILRTGGVMIKIAEDLKKVSPHAWILNYSNPMAMNVGVLAKCDYKNSVGLCHSIQGCYKQIARWLGINPDEIVYTAGGINHRDFYLKLEHKGRSIYPELLANAERIIKDAPAERMRFELLKYLGYFPAEGPMHQGEYYPWFAKDLKACEHYGAEVYWGYKIDSSHFKKRTLEIQKQLSGKVPVSYKRSDEYGARIINSMMTGKLRSFYGNVPNNGLISNLPHNAIVEVPCMVDRNGVTPCAIGDIPIQLASVISPHVYVNEMAVDAVLAKDRVLLRQAIQADPLTSAILTLPRIEKMTDELLEANRDYLKDWK
ncbi:MAG: alpha-galactosidase [Lentisphaerae bacterium]|nr:alpha-galactosidase [Lentisphaerota bacterium]